LLTGGEGFAGSHLRRRLRDAGRPPAAPSRAELDLLDADAVHRLVAELQPAELFHLAAFSSVRNSWDAPGEVAVQNLQMTANVLEAVRQEAPQCRILLVGSGQVYGDQSELPTTEESPLRPGNPYAISKTAGDQLAGLYAAAHGVHVVRARPFNHVGPGQSAHYVLSSLTRQVAEAEARGLNEALLRTGDVNAARDFTDVRDVVRAYDLLVQAQPRAYNVCSGRGTTVAQLIELLKPAARVEIRHEVDPARLRPHDAPDLRGSNERLTAATGWRPEIPLDQTVRDTLDWWRERVAAGE